MPDYLYDEFCRICGENVSRETFFKLAAYVDMIIQWQSRINLIGNSTKSDIWQRHIFDCVQLVPLIKSRFSHSAIKIVDIGTGAGLPGVILSLISSIEISLIEPDKKKYAFLNEVKSQLKLNANIICDKAQIVQVDCDVIVSRACAPLTELFSISENIYQQNQSKRNGEGVICLFPKGKNYSIELADADCSWNYNKIIHKNQVEEGGVILEITSVERVCAS